MAFLPDQTEDSGFKTCRFDYPATHKFLLNAFTVRKYNPDSTKIVSSFMAARNYFLNSIITQQCPHRLCEDACTKLFTDIEWQVNSNGGSGSVMIGKNGIFRRNTVQRAGNCEGVRAIDKGAVIELNRITDVGNLQHDGAAINVGTTKHAGTRIAYNGLMTPIARDYALTTTAKRFATDGKIYADGSYVQRELEHYDQPSWGSPSRPEQHWGNCSRYPNPEKEQVTLAIQGFRSMHGIMGIKNSLIRNNIATIKNRSWNLDATMAPLA